MSLSIGLDVGAKAPISSSSKKKVFYIIRRIAGGYIRVNGSGSFSGSYSISGATQFNTVPGALCAIAKRAAVYPEFAGDTFNIVRVEETAGSEHRVILGELQQEPAGSTVKYAIFGECAHRFNRGESTVLFQGAELSDAKLYNTTSDALAFIQRAGESLGRVSIKRVAVIAGTPTLTETVLS